MFTKIPGLFERNFVLGYLLPSLIWILMSSQVFKQFSSEPLLFKFLQFIELDVTSLLTTINGLLLVYIGGIFLLAINRELLRSLEGYGKLNPFRLLYFIGKFKFNKIESTIKELDSQYLNCYENGEEFPPTRMQKRTKLMIEVVQKFPDREEYLLPTSFGNAIRGFEVYPRLMYGIDAIPAWSRLLTIIPLDYRKLIDDAKAIVDLWANLWLITIFVLIEYLIIIFDIKEIKLIWLPVLLLVFAFICFSRATAAAIIWGDYIKAAFDVYLPELQKKMGFVSTDSDDSELESESKLMWQKFSQAVIYHKPEYMPKRIQKKTQNEDYRSDNKIGSSDKQP